MKITLALIALLAIWPFSSGKDYHMTASSQVPAASGTVHVQKDTTNGDVKLDIKVAHLARPASLTPPADFYIVWIRPKDGRPVKQGAIGVNGDLNGELKTETVSKDFDLFITPEDSKSVTYPSGQDILRAHVSVG